MKSFLSIIILFQFLACIAIFLNSCCKATLPIVITANVSEISVSTAVSGGNVIDNGGANVTARGVCWSTNENPDIKTTKTNDGTGNGSFISTITGLTANTKYYIRAYATNIEGTSYGENISFTTSSLTVTDEDGNTYNTITIGSQTWTKENLRTTRYNDGTTIQLIINGTEWASLTTPAFCWANNDESTYKYLYGAFYNWYVVNTRKICPSGWHVPSDNEWKVLEIYLGMNQTMANLTGYRGTIEGRKLKSESGWYQNGNGSNETGFSALPTGWRDYGGDYYFIGIWTDFWTSTEINYDNAWSRSLGYTHDDIGRNEDSKKFGFGIRCIKD